MANIDYINESFFAVLGLTGMGKSSFLNAISDSESCVIGNLGKACTQTNQLVSFVYKNHRFNAIDTPGLDDTDNNDQKINVLKGLLSVHPKIKKIILVKKYNDVRLPLSMQSAIITFMEAFPLRNFWDHVIIVNSWANPHDETVQDYLNEPHEKFWDKILECNKLMETMKSKNIYIPDKNYELKEYYICSKKIKKYDDIKETFNQIKDEIKKSQMMFKQVIISDIQEKSWESKKNKGFYIIRKFKTITCIDFNDVKAEFEEFIEEKEVAPKECTVVDTKEEEEFIENDEVRWYDVLSLGILRAIRNTKKYRVYKINIYQVGDKRIEGDKVEDRIIFK